MDFKEMTIEQLDERKAEIAIGVDASDADLDALEEEVRGIKEELERRAAEEAKKAEIRKAVAVGGGQVVKTVEKEERKVMTNEEIRKSPEYVDAFANYLKSGDDKECRALLTAEVSGTVPVPVIVDDIIRTAWEKDDILSRVRKTAVRGNLKVAFELSATGAWVHTEGTSAPTEESLTLGIVTMIPRNIKKWITISDEAVAMGGEAFVRYVYDELTYQIIKKLSALVVGDIAGASTSNSSSAIGVPKVTKAPGVSTVPAAFSNLTDNATNPVVIMNKATYVEFYEAYANGNFAVDPFMGFDVVYTSALPAYSTASTNAVYAIVGDLRGSQVNYPEGQGIVVKWDDLSLSEKDMVKVVGRQYAGHAVTTPGMFVNLAKPAAATT